MLEPTASRFWQAALQSGLVETQALQACWDAIPEDKRVPEHIDRRLARLAVQSGIVTLWQAQQLISGRSTGFKIDRYVLLELIGQGGMGRVYLAKDSRLNRRVALKILSPERVNNPRAIARFHREAMVGAQLQHEHLVRIYDEGEANGRCYLVMEFIEGKNIGQMIAEDGPIPPSVASKLARQVALGLEHAQRKGLIHRDVNPYNILVTRDGTAKLTDLGLAIDLAETDQVTRDGATVGTFDYVSPEQARHSHSVDTRSDIYSLGCTLYHMLTGQVPFPSPSLPEKLFGHQASEPEPLESLAPGVPKGLVDVVVRTMKKAPDDRYPTPIELAQALEPFADDAATNVGSDVHPLSRHSSRVAATVTQIAAAPKAIPTPLPVPAANVEPALAAFIPPAEPKQETEDTPFLGINLSPESETAPAKPKPKAPAHTAPEARPEIAAFIPPAGPKQEQEAEGSPFLGINLSPESETAPAKPKPKAPAPPAPEARAEPVPPVAAFMVPPEPPAKPDVEGNELFGLNLSVDPEPSLSRVPAPPKPKPKAPPAHAPTSVKSPEPEPPAFALPPETPSHEPVGPFGIDLSVNLGPEPSLSRAPAPAKPKLKPEAPAPAPVKTPEPEPTAAPSTGGDDLFGLNFGPEPSLSGASATAPTKPKPKPKASAPAPKPDTPVVARAGAPARPKWLVPAVAGTGVLVLLAGTTIVYKAFSKPGTVKAAVASSTGASKAKETVAAPPVKKTAAATTGTKFAGPQPEGKQVAVMAGDGTVTIEKNLHDAMSAAIGARGYVLLLNETPLTVPTAESIKISGGTLVIKAGEGVRPVLNVEVKGGKSFLSTSTRTPLKIEGVTIVAKYVEPGADPAPVILAGSDVTLDRCAFKVEGPAPANARAVAVEGGTLTATGCWFENFGRAIDIACFGGSVTTLRHCAAVRTRADDPAVPLPTVGAVRLRSMPGGLPKSGRKLVMDHCTARGKSFLEFAGFSPQAPVSVDLTACAVMADALVAWEPGPVTREALAWTGLDNQYDVHGKSWVVIAAKGAPETPMPDGPINLETWSRQLANERDPIPPPVQFATDPSSLSENAKPTDFAVAGAGVRNIGADPAYVGPGAKPVQAVRRKP